MHDHGKRNADKSRPRTCGIVATLAVLLCLAPVMAPAQQQQDPDRLPAGALPTQSFILEDENLDGFSLNIEFVEVDIRDVVLFFGQLTGINMVLDPGVSGAVTTQLFDVPWDTALLTILESHDLGYHVQRNILRITTVTKLAADCVR